MASSLSSLCSTSPFFCRHKVFKYPQVRSHSFRDEGNSANIVDANLSTLWERIAEVRKKESLDCCRLKKEEGKLKNGWNYQSGYDHNRKRDAMMSESMELIGFVSGALGMVILSGSLCICLVSLLVHFSI
ncbi:hypothetical protein CFOL_v3_31944 [Cephalotus follicularis]|uniref:Uncharacterized protein n=1 Tax=Cephalotus follicularis TaxID=3775 RepID=A0A1Q3D7T7_CEPFO|nr:hypothetical protein CFOL_v3_31944 [Cephalotus follicularis]